MIGNVLWSSRYLVLIAVIASVIGAIGMFCVSGADAARVVSDVIKYVTLDPHAAEAARPHIVSSIAGFIDGFLFAAVLLIFALGLYELFIGKIEAAEHSEFASRLLLIQTLDDLKDRLAKVIFLILIVRYFEYALQSEITQPIELLYLAIGIALIAASLYLTGSKGKYPKASHAEEP